MCAQCMATAATVAAGGAGLRAWVAAKRPAGLGPRGLRLLSGVLVGASVVAAGVLSSAG